MKLEQLRKKVCYFIGGNGVVNHQGVWSTIKGCGQPINGVVCFLVLLRINGFLCKNMKNRMCNIAWNGVIKECCNVNQLVIDGRN